jgi:hypothetical protein
MQSEVRQQEAVLMEQSMLTASRRVDVHLALKELHARDAGNAVPLTMPRELSKVQSVQVALRLITTSDLVCQMMFSFCIFNHQ